MLGCIQVPQNGHMMASSDFYQICPWKDAFKRPPLLRLPRIVWGQYISIRVEVFFALPCVDFVLCSLAFTIQHRKILFSELIRVSIATNIPVLDGKPTTQGFRGHWSSAVFTAAAGQQSLGTPTVSIALWSAGDRQQQHPVYSKCVSGPRDHGCFPGNSCVSFIDVPCDHTGHLARVECPREVGKAWCATAGILLYSHSSVDRYGNTVFWLFGLWDSFF